MLKNSLIWAVLLTVLSCATDSTHDKNVYYKRDMKVEINKREYIGVAVLTDVSRLKIKAKFKDDGDLVRIKTCHRSIDIEQAWKEKSFFKRLSKTSAEIDLKLTSPIETTQECAIEIIAFSHSGKHTWFFAVRDTGEKLPATLRCNGETSRLIGTSICQVKSGLVQQIEFNGKTNVRRGANCVVTRLADNKFEFRPNKGVCSARFFDEKGLNHRLTTIGYDSIKLRK